MKLKIIYTPAKIEIVTCFLALRMLGRDLPVAYELSREQLDPRQAGLTHRN